MISTYTEIYTQRFQVNPPYFVDPPDESLCLSIVIPAFKEPNIWDTLHSLGRCRPPSGMVEVIVVINAPEKSPEEHYAINQGTVAQVLRWEKEEMPPHIEALVIREESLPQKHAGAGWARKIGMDESIRRWAQIEKDGPILCLDADCSVSGNYLLAAEKAFEKPAAKVGHFHFEHPYSEETDPIVKEGIIHYELHLRCYVNGLKIAGYPNAVHTVGSSMAVRASTYAKSGGMNRRKAGEDFYFLHKLVPLGGWVNIPATVYPSCRVSDRVPFGTGKAQTEWQQNQTLLTYDPTIYTLMQPLFHALPNWYEKEPENNDIEHLHPVLIDFLTSVQAIPTVGAIHNESNSREVFVRKIWQWMDGFMVLRMTHYLRDHGFPSQPVLTAARSLLGVCSHMEASLEEALEAFRKVDSRRV